MTIQDLFDAISVPAFIVFLMASAVIWGMVTYVWDQIKLGGRESLAKLKIKKTQEIRKL